MVPTRLTIPTQAHFLLISNGALVLLPIKLKVGIILEGEGVLFGILSQVQIQLEWWEVIAQLLHAQ